MTRRNRVARMTSDARRPRSVTRSSRSRSAPVRSAGIADTSVKAATIDMSEKGPTTLSRLRNAKAKPAAAARISGAAAMIRLPHHPLVHDEERSSESDDSLYPREEQRQPKLRHVQQADEELDAGHHEQRPERATHRGTSRDQDRDARRDEPEGRDLRGHAARILADQRNGHELARGRAKGREARRRGGGCNHRRHPQPPSGILAVGPIARRDVKDAESDERSAAFDRELPHAELPRAHGVRRKGNPEQRERRIAKLPRAVRGDGGERDDAQGDHCRVDQMRSATIKTVASQTPARCSKIAKAPELTVTARSSTRNPATPAGTGSAAHTMRCNRDTKTSRSGSTGRMRRALIARIVATTTSAAPMSGSAFSSGRPSCASASGIGSARM